MRVLLVVPPSPFLLDDRTFPNLGVLWVAASLRRARHEVAVLDLCGRSDYTDVAREWAEGRDVIGFTANTPQMPYAYRAFKAMKESSLPDTRFIIGGPHASFAPTHCLGLGFDQVVMDDGVDGGPRALASEDRMVKGGLIDLGDYPLPARDLVDMGSYHYTLPGTDLPATNTMFSQGCPYTCSFCSGRELSYYRRLRLRPPAHILLELDHLRDTYGFRAFQVYDDEVNLRLDWLDQVCAALRGRGYSWRAFIKANLFNDQVAQAMLRGGCVEVCTGVESGSDRILKDQIQKKTTYAINLAARLSAKRAGLRFKAFCSIGHPSETIDDILLTERWLLEARPDDFDLTVISPMPGSPIYDRRYSEHMRRDFVVTSFPEFELEFEERDFAQEDSYYKTVPGEYKAWTSTPTLTSSDLEGVRDAIDTRVRAELCLPSLLRPSPFEHSMGQGG